MSRNDYLAKIKIWLRHDIFVSKSFDNQIIPIFAKLRNTELAAFRRAFANICFKKLFSCYSLFRVFKNNIKYFSNKWMCWSQSYESILVLKRDKTSLKFFDKVWRHLTQCNLKSIQVTHQKRIGDKNSFSEKNSFIG